MRAYARSSPIRFWLTAGGCHNRPLAPRGAEPRSYARWSVFHAEPPGQSCTCRSRKVAVSLPAVPERRVRVAVVKSSAHRQCESTRNPPEFHHAQRGNRSPDDEAPLSTQQANYPYTDNSYASVILRSCSHCSAHATLHVCVRYRTEKTVGFRAQMRKFVTSFVSGCWAITMRRDALSPVSS
jgi:hypothetical protein